MEASSTTRKRAGNSLGLAMFSTRRGSITTAIVAAVLAGILLFLFVEHNKGGAGAVVNTPVFVASGYIPKGTPAGVIASGSLISRSTVPSTKVVAGAIADPSVLKGEVAASAIYPGQQLTTSDFTAADVTVTSQLTGTQRAIAIPVDSAHGLIGFVQAGDHVDVMSDNGSGQAGQGGVSTLAQNVVVLSAPNGGGGGLAGGGGSGGNIVLQVTPAQAAAFAYAADNGKVWITLRPPVGALGTTTSDASGKK